MKESERWRLVSEPTVSHIDFGSQANINRQEDLLSILRFDGIDKDRMIQRFSVADHNMRVLGLTGVFAETLDMIGVEIDVEVAMWSADYHDEPERITGDVTTDVKLQMSEEERIAFEVWELEAMRKLEETLDKPTWAQSAEGIYEKYRRKDTIEARVVNFFDKWDASNEVVHEFVCGGGAEEFSPILERYRGTISDLREQNSDWLPQLEQPLFGEDRFIVPEQESLKKRNVEDLSFDSIKDFVSSIASDNPYSYGLWLELNSFFWGVEFIDRTFPGWTDDIPEEIIRAAHLTMNGETEFKTPSGLIIESAETNEAMKFARSMNARSVTELFEMIDRRI